MTISVRRRRFKTLAHAVLVTLAIQFIPATASGACMDMSASDESHALHAAHGNRVLDGLEPEGSFISSHSEGEQDAARCDCPPSAPSESDRSHCEACVVAMHCVSSPAVVSVAELLPDPAGREQTLVAQPWSARSLVLSHPTPPPRA